MEVPLQPPSHAYFTLQSVLRGAKLVPRAVSSVQKSTAASSARPSCSFFWRGTTSARWASACRPARLDTLMLETPT